MLSGKRGAFWYTLEEFHTHWDRIDVICPRSAASDQRLAVSAHFGNVYFHPSPYPLWRQPQWIVQQGQKLIQHYRHGVMTVHEYPPFYNGIGARMLSKKTGVPYVLEVHHIVGYPKPASSVESIGKFMSRIYLPWAIRNSDATRVVNKSAAETLISWRAPAGKIRVVPSFYLDRELLTTLGDAPPVQYDVVFCGRLVANKGVAELLLAIAKVPRATLLVIGDGPQRGKLELMARELGIMNRTEFRGWLPTQADVLRAIRSAKMLVMNSTSEGGPRVSLEAMAAGVPVISTKVGVMPDVLIDGGNGLFTNGKPDDLAEKINQLIQNPELRTRMGSNAHDILERFERKKLIGQYAFFLKSFAKPL